MNNINLVIGINRPHSNENQLPNVGECVQSEHDQEIDEANVSSAGSSNSNKRR